MSKIDSIKQQIEKLSPEELATFRPWYAAFDAEVWDRQFEADVKAASSMPWVKRPFVITPPASRRNFDPSRFPRILGLLQRTSCFHPRTSQQSL